MNHSCQVTFLLSTGYMFCIPPLCYKNKLNQWPTGNKRPVNATSIAGDTEAQKAFDSFPVQRGSKRTKWTQCICYTAAEQLFCSVQQSRYTGASTRHKQQRPTVKRPRLSPLRPTAVTSQCADFLPATADLHSRAALQQNVILTGKDRLPSVRVQVRLLCNRFPHYTRPDSAILFITKLLKHKIYIWKPLLPFFNFIKTIQHCFSV